MNGDTYFERLQKIKLGQLPKEAIAKTKKPLNKIGAKKRTELEEKKLSGDSVLDLFFDAMRKRCKGKCYFCNSPTMYKHDELWRIAIAHLLPKSKFKSVATNEYNWVELCWDCHTNFDNGKISWTLLSDSKEWEQLKEHLLLILPMVAQEERKHKLYSKLESLVYDKRK